MKEYLKNFVIFIILSFVAAVIFRIVLPKTMDIRILGNVTTITGVSGIVNANVSGAVNANVSGAVDANVSGGVDANVSGLIKTKTKVGF